MWDERRAVTASLSPNFQPLRPKSADSISAFGSVREVLRPTNKQPIATVLHIQDVHMNPEAQRNISGAIQLLSKQNKIGVIALEGAFAPIELSPFHNFPHQPTVRGVADYLLKERKISGVMHAMLGKDGAVVGIDDEPHYLANVAAYRGSIPLRAAVKREIWERKQEIAIKKSQIFNSQLLAFDAKTMAYHDKKLTMAEYLPLLESKSDEDGQLRIFLEALHLESSRIRTVKNYSRYMKLVESIDIEKLLGEIKSAEDAAYAALARTSDERKLIWETRRLCLIEKLVEFALTRDEWDEYKALGRVGWGNKIPSTSAFEDFYRQAELRDTAMANNLFRVLSTTCNVPRTSFAVLVTGGFHSSGIDQRLVDAGYEVIIFIPKITTIDTANGSAYLSVFSQQKTPLDKLFDGEKLFLSPPQWNRSTLGLFAVLVAATAVINHFVSAEFLNGWLGRTLGSSDVSLAQVGQSTVQIVLGAVAVGITINFPNPYLSRLDARVIAKPPFSPGAWAFWLHIENVFRGILRKIGFDVRYRARLTVAQAEKRLPIYGALEVLVAFALWAATPLQPLDVAYVMAFVHLFMHTVFGVFVPNKNGSFEALHVLNLRGPPTSKIGRFLLGILSANLVVFFSAVPSVLLFESNTFFNFASALIPHLVLHSLFNFALVQRTIGSKSHFRAAIVYVVSFSCLWATAVYVASLDQGIVGVVRDFNIADESYLMSSMALVMALIFVFRKEIRLQSATRVEYVPARRLLRESVLTALPVFLSVGALTVKMAINPMHHINAAQAGEWGLFFFLVGVASILLARKPTERGWLINTVAINGAILVWFARDVARAVTSLTIGAGFGLWSVAIISLIVGIAFLGVKFARAQATMVAYAAPFEAVVLVRPAIARALLILLPVLDWTVKQLIVHTSVFIEQHGDLNVPREILPTQIAWFIVFGLSFLFRVPLSLIFVMAGALGNATEIALWGGAFNPILLFGKSVNVSDLLMYVGIGLVVKDAIQLLVLFFRSDLTPFLLSTLNPRGSIRKRWFVAAFLLLSIPYVGTYFGVIPFLHPTIKREIELSNANGWPVVRRSILLDVFHMKDRAADRQSYFEDDDKRRFALATLNDIAVIQNWRAHWTLSETGKEFTMIMKDVPTFFQSSGNTLVIYLRQIEFLKGGDFQPRVLTEMPLLSPADLEYLRPHISATFEQRWSHDPSLRTADFNSLSMSAVLALARGGSSGAPAMPRIVRDAALDYLKQTRAGVIKKMGIQIVDFAVVTNIDHPSEIFHLNQREFEYIGFTEPWYVERWSDPENVKKDTLSVSAKSIANLIERINSGRLFGGRPLAEALEKELNRRQNQQKKVDEQTFSLNLSSMKADGVLFDNRKPVKTNFYPTSRTLHGILKAVGTARKSA